MFLKRGEQRQGQCGGMIFFFVSMGLREHLFTLQEHYIEKNNYSSHSWLYIDHYGILFPR